MKARMPMLGTAIVTIFAQAAGATLFGSDDTANQIVIIDTSTGAGTPVGPTSSDLSLSGMTYDTSTLTMYISNIDDPGSGEIALATVDTATGATTIVGLT